MASHEAIGIAILGCGDITRQHLPGWKALVEAGDVRLEVLCDVDSSRAEAFADEYGAASVATDFEEVVNRPEVEAVDICLPHHLHLPAILAAAKAGVHVLCEKPLTLDVKEAEQAVRACREAGVRFMTATRDRFEPHARIVKKVIDTGLIGEVYMLLERHMLRKDVITQGNANKMEWKLGKSTSGGGALHRDGSYYFDTIRYFADSEVSRVTGAEFDNFLWQTEEIETTSHVLYRFESGAIGVFEYVWCLQGPHKREVVINGSEGYLELTGAIGDDATITVHSNKLPQVALDDAKVLQSFDETVHKRPHELSPDVTGESLVIRAPFVRGYQAVEAELVRAIREGREPESSGLDGARAIEFIDAAYRSAKEEQPVSLPLVDWASL